ncbi:MAG: DUF3024 domain-containing protein [Bacteroidota bacterium]|nr:DUF3024 domain-containing protein [Bacteroidota bacterium]
MAFDVLQTVEIIELMENYIERIRPAIEIRDKIDIGYRIEGQSVFLFERRPSWNDPTEIMDSDYAKTTYDKKNKVWKIYWMRANGQWNTYQPCKTVIQLKEFINEVELDKYHCFKG